MSAARIELMAITDDPALGVVWHEAGVDRIMVDLETFGKAERQRFRDTVKSDHTVADVSAMRAELPSAHIVVRCEPMSMPGWRDHLDALLDASPSSVMLPMLERAVDARGFSEAVDGRADVIVMIETASALRDVDAIAGAVGSGTLFVGLNDLHVQLGHRFMFEPLSGGHVDEVAEAARRHGLAFGFGGLAKPGTGVVDPALIVREHVRLGSSLAILARSFFGALGNPSDRAAVAAGIGELRSIERAAHRRSPDQERADASTTAAHIESVASGGAEPGDDATG